MAQPPPFADRHIGPRPEDIERMLAEVGAESLDHLIDEAVPTGIRAHHRFDLPAAASEEAVLGALSELAARNTPMISLIGLGYHDTITPPVIQRNVLESPAWYTAYTPYQAEISQGRLEALLNFQTMVADLTGLEMANASLLDEATAAAEAMAMARRLTRRHDGAFLIDVDCHPQTMAVVTTRAEAVGTRAEVVSLADASFEGAAGVLVQYPGSSGELGDPGSVITRAREAGAVAVVATDLLASVLLEPAGALGADIAVGSAQRFGVPMGFGGPHAGFIAVRPEHVRALPGRLVGVSVDAGGRPAYRLALQTREQHIRRERATSNVCTAQVLLAVVAGFYACWHGPEGLGRIARRVADAASRLAGALAALPHVEVQTREWFDTFTVSSRGRAAQVLRAARDLGINLRPVDADTVAISLDEVTSEKDLVRVVEAFGGEPARLGEPGEASAVPPPLRRSTPILTHPVFTSHQSEHEMLRYLRRLADKDLALDRTMIPLGSCTMKLNATTEMVPMTWPAFARMHPFAPLDQAAGYLELFSDLESYLADLTGYDAVSLQPNAGSQGELAGLLAIRAYHRSRGEPDRTICLIPSSAHGTNAASAVMAGMEVVVVACDESGNVDPTDLELKAVTHSDRLAAVMVTYPSTHGVFEPGIEKLCEIVHAHGGQVYVDGANLNALVGLARPGDFGADLGHLNLHKTFTIPHGGGGPGVGPVGVKAHLAPFLPNHPLVPQAGPERGVGPVAAAPWGSAGILPIPWVYIRLMGADGLTRATKVAILSANYLARRLDPYYPVLYAGPGGRVAHECILDIRPITRSTGVTAEDIAKRLADYGFHAPTLSFPVPGTLMIEPTESEPIGELDRFCRALIAVRAEIAAVADGTWPADDNPLVRAPHPALDVIQGWDRPYPAEVAAFPLPEVAEGKYWPPVGRVDSATGDRNLICSCPPPEYFERSLD